MTTRAFRRSGISLLLAALCAGASGNAAAVELSDRIDLHGFGYQDYVQSSANTYLGADHKGSWDNNFLGLVMSAALTDNSKLWAQLEDTATGGTAVTWAFVDYDLTDAARVHAGRVKFPLGFYNETIDAKPLQPAALEPALYQHGADMVHDAYHGVGIDYEQDLGGSHVRWQLYGGNSYDTDPPVDSRDRRMAGARITWQPPVDGLTLMLSGYRTQVEVLATGRMVNEDRTIASAGYQAGAWDVKAEAGVHHFMGVNSRAWYLQAAYAATDRIKPYVRYDAVVTDTQQRQDPSYFQNTWVAGVGLQVSPAIGLRLENHFNRGYALPVGTGEVDPGTGTRNWNLTVLAANFQF